MAAQSFGQGGGQTNLPTVNFLSPQTADFVRYGNVPASHFTGGIDLKIPIYTYTDKDFALPIFLGYNSSGFSPGQQDGLVGLNWFLNAGGVITRKVNGFVEQVETGECGCEKNQCQHCFYYLCIRKCQPDAGIFISCVKYNKELINNGMRIIC